MESQQQGHSVQVEMEKLNGEQSAEPLPSHSSLCLKRGIVLVSVVGLLAVSFTCLLFIFVFWPVCVQDPATPPPPPPPPPTPPPTPPPATTGKVNLTRRLKALEPKGLYDIFQTEKHGRYLIHGWLHRSTYVSEDVLLQHRRNGITSNLKKYMNNSEFMLYFNTEVQLYPGSKVILSVSQLTDGFFYVQEL